ncbi:MAG: hypothetical protein II270_04770 [Peptococcaceae bacterium]|nr:hypothetical protein [Peptococcaceae bacterium]
MLDITYEGNPAELPGLTLAYVGDAVYELYVREQILKQSVKAHNLHYLAVKPGNSAGFPSYVMSSIGNRLFCISNI